MSRRSVRRVKKRVAATKASRRGGKMINLWSLAIGIGLTLTAVALMRSDSLKRQLDFGPRERIPILVPYGGPELGNLESFPRPFQEYFTGDLNLSSADRFDLAFDQDSLVVRFAPLKSGIGGTLDHPALDVQGSSADELFSSRFAGLTGRGLGFEQSVSLRRKEAAARGTPSRGLTQNLPGGGGRRDQPKNSPGGGDGPSGDTQSDGDRNPDKCVNDCGDQRDEGPRAHPSEGPDRLRPAAKQVPEPGSLALLGLGLLAIVGAVWRLKSSS